MTLSGSLLLAVLAQVPATEPVAQKSQRRPVDRVSETLLSTNEAWNEFGFRLQLGLASEQLRRTNDLAPGGAGVGPTLHLGARLNRSWSIFGGLRYSILRNRMTGVRFTATAEAMLHVIWGLSVSAGFGYGGMAGGLSRKREIDYAQYFDDPAPIDISGRSTTNATQRFNNCDGSGAVVLARTQYLMTVGDMFATGPEIRFEHQWTRCTDRNMRAFLRADLQKMPTQWWAQRSFTYGWVLAWR